MKLSIITPYYKTLNEIKRLAEVLEPQLTDEIEWIIIDDGCNEKELDKLKANIVHLPFNSGGASVPRNVGLDIAKGDYIAFIDSDDLVSEDYIYQILKKLKTDIIYLSWKSQKHDIKLIQSPSKWNCSVWCRVYKKDIIADTRFKPELKIAEDWEFNTHIKPITSCVIKKQIYFYNIRENSLVRGGNK